MEVQSRLGVFYEAWSCIGSGFVRGFTSQESRKPCRYTAGFKPRFFTFKGNWIAKVAFHSYCIWQLSISILENSCHALDYSGHMGVLSIINCDTICIGIANEQFGILTIVSWSLWAIGRSLVAPLPLPRTCYTVTQQTSPTQHLLRGSIAGSAPIIPSPTASSTRHSPYSEQGVIFAAVI